MVQGIKNRFFCNLVEKDSINVFSVVSDLLGDVPGDGFSLSIGIGSEIDVFHALACFLQLPDDLAFTSDGDIGGLKIVFKIDPQFALREIFNMADGGFDDVVVPKKFLKGLYFRRRFYNYQTF